MAYSKTTWKDRNVQFPNRFTKIDNADGTTTLNVAQGSIIEQGTPVNATNLNNMELGIEAVSDATYFKEVGGSATAITVNLNTTLVDGLPINFICKYANGGGTTTLNGVLIKRAITGTNPTFSAGQLVTVVYSQANNCFFYKAISYGNATVDKVLDGRIFSNDQATGLVGTIPNNGDLTQMIQSVGGTYNIPKGYNSGGVISSLPASTIFRDCNITNSNQVKRGYSIYGKDGVKYEGSYEAFNIKSGVVTSYSSNGRTYCNCPDIPSPPKYLVLFSRHYNRDNSNNADYPFVGAFTVVDTLDNYIKTVRDPNNKSGNNFYMMQGVSTEALSGYADSYINKHQNSSMANNFYYNYSNGTATVMVATTTSYFVGKTYAFLAIY